MQEIPSRDQITCGQVVDLYLSLGTKNLAPASLDLFKLALREFREEFADKRVVDCRAIDLMRYMQSKEERWLSVWTRAGRLTPIKRAFNWAVDADLLAVNPFTRVKVEGQKRRRRAMSDEDYQSILRASPPHWRRFVIFLRFTGCRTIEGCSLRWDDVDLAKGVAILQKHKTARKTGKPRIIPLPPVVIKLLVWMRQHRQASVVGLLEQYLATGPKRILEVSEYMKRFGVSGRSMYRARMRLGVEKVRVGGYGPKSYCEYRLPDDHRVPDDPAASDRVFLTSEGNPVCKDSIGCMIGRLRARGVIPKGVSLYMLRHAFGTRGVKNGVNLKLISLAMGHASIVMTEGYVTDESLADEVLAATAQINHGANAKLATANAKPEQPPRMIEMPVYAVPITEMTTKAVVLPSRANDSPRQAVPLEAITLAEIPDPNAVLMNRLLAKLESLEGDKPKRTREVVAPAGLSPATQAAWDSLQWAIEQNPAMASAADSAVFAWLKARADCPFKLPPAQDTFRRYISMARLSFDCRKRVLRERTDGAA